MRIFVFGAFCVAAICQTASAPRIEAASVKPSRQNPGNGSGFTTGHGRIHGENVTLRRCIIGAWSVGPNQIIGGPDWLDTDRFEIEAKADQPVGDSALMTLLQGILASRFSLALHHESRQQQVYLLEVAKIGPKLASAAGGQSFDQNGRGRIDSRNTSMEHFAQILGRQMDLPVLNRTGLDGVYNLKLEWTPEAAQQGNDAGPTIYTAIQEQLGLRLRSARMPVDVLVIDHAERPTEN